MAEAKLNSSVLSHRLPEPERDYRGILMAYGQLISYGISAKLKKLQCSSLTNNALC